MHTLTNLLAPQLGARGASGSSQTTSAIERDNWLEILPGLEGRGGGACPFSIVKSMPTLQWVCDINVSRLGALEVFNLKSHASITPTFLCIISVTKEVCVPTPLWCND